MDSLIIRLSNYEDICNFFQEFNISENNCEITLKHHPLFDNKTKLGKGGYNIVYSLQLKDTDKKFIMRVPKPDNTDSNFTYVACMSDQYALLFSKLTHFNIIPNYPLVINSYLCNNDYSKYKPVSLQEFATHGELTKHLTNNLLSKNIKQSVLQSILTLYHMHTIFNLSHNDMKPENVLLTEIKPSIFHYVINDTYITFNTNFIALISDFDLVTSTSDTLTHLYIFKYYITKLLLTIYASYENKNHELNITSVNINEETKEQFLINHIIKLKDIKEFDEKHSKYFIEELFVIYEFDTHDIVLIKNICRKVLSSDSLLYRNISQLLLCCIMYKLPTYELDFLDDFVINEIDFISCIKKHFSDVVSFSNMYEGTGMLYNLNTKINLHKMYANVFTEHKSIFSCAINNETYKLKPSSVIDNLYNLNRFKIQKTITDEELHEYINTEIENYHIPQINRKQLFEHLTHINTELSDAGFILKLRNNELLNIFKMIDFYVIYGTHTDNALTLSLAVFYLLTTVDIDIIAKYLIKSNKNHLFIALEHLLETLVNNP